MIGFKFKKREKLAAVFLISTFLIILTTFVLMGNFNQWFSDKNIYYSEFSTVGGLKVGSPVEFKKNELVIGTVQDISVDLNNDRIDVTIEIYKKFENKIREDSIAYLSQPMIPGITGKAKVQLSIGSERFPVLENKRKLPSNDSYEGRVMIASKKPMRGDDDLSRIRSNLADMTAPNGPLMQTLYNVEVITHQFKEGNGIPTIMGLVDQVDIATRKSLTNINSITQNIDHLVEANVVRVDKVLNSVTYQLNMILVELGKTSGILLKKVVTQSEPILQESKRAISRALKDLTSAISATAGSVENNVTASLKDVRLIVQNVKILTRRLNNMMDRVERLSVFGGVQKKRGTLVDEVERGDY